MDEDDDRDWAFAARWSFPRHYSAPSGTHWLDDPLDTTCKDAMRQDDVDGWEATHNRSVAGSSFRRGR